MTEETGIKIEYLDQLMLFDDSFSYGGETFQYKNIRDVNYKAVVTKRSVNFIPAGTTYETDLYLVFFDGQKLNIRQERSGLFGNQKMHAQAIMRASSFFHEITFTQRMDNYENGLNEKGYITWANYQIASNGDLFKNQRFIFNLKDDDVNKTLDVFSFQAGKKPSNLKEILAKAWSGNETIDISTNKDCFLYFMKHYLGYTWKDEPVKTKQKNTQEEFYEAILILGAKVCKADGRISPDEIKVFKTYFGIDQNTYPNSSAVFTAAIASSQTISEPAKKVYELLNGNKESLEHIVIGLIKIATVDSIVTDKEKAVLESICKEFKFNDTDIHRLFLIFNKASRANYSHSKHTEYLEILGLKENASREDIKVAYRNLVRKHHPDILYSQGLPIELIRESEEIMKAANAAYQRLSENR